VAKTAKAASQTRKPSKVVVVKAPPPRPTRPGAKLAIAGGTPVSATPVPFMSTALSQADIDAALAVLTRAWGTTTA